MYEGDSPLAEKRAAALALDSTLLAELLGQADLRELLDAGAIASVEDDLQRRSPDRQARGLEGVADLLRMLGPLTTAEAIERGATAVWLHELEAARRAIRTRIAGAEHWAAIEDAGRLRDALGAPIPVGVPEAFLELVADPVSDLVARYARTHGPFQALDVAHRFGLGVAVVQGALARLTATGRVVEGEFRPGGSGNEWCDAEVLRTLRRRSLALLRKEVEPVPPVAFARYLPAWQGVGSGLRGVDGVLRVVEQLAGAAVPASALERLVLPGRVLGYSPALLDELMASGEVTWSGAGALPGDDGWVALHLAEQARHDRHPDRRLRARRAPPPHPGGARGRERPVPSRDRRAADRWTRGPDASGHPDEGELTQALWDLVWAGHLTNDTLGPLRGLSPAAGALTEPAGRRPGSDTAGQGERCLQPGAAPASASGRWSLLPEPAQDLTRRAAHLAEVLLDRYGVVTRGSVVAEHASGGFAAAYRVLSAFEETGRCRRGYLVEGLGAAQFAVPGAVDRLRAQTSDRRERSPAVVLAATDPGERVRRRAELARTRGR